MNVPIRPAHAEDAERAPPDRRRRRPRGGRFSRRALPPPLARPSGGAAPQFAPEYRRGVPDRVRPREGDALTLALDPLAGLSGGGLVPGGAHGLDLVHHLGQLGEDRLVVEGLP